MYPLRFTFLFRLGRYRCFPLGGFFPGPRYGLSFLSLPNYASAPDVPLILVCLVAYPLAYVARFFSLLEAINATGSIAMYYIVEDSKTLFNSKQALVMLLL